ncbi:MAG: hypothetical protein S4CHLAM123_07880 [Chlamydiales bacterium]|nr:hypothetical protein [Chlamydiales bacterium]
MSLEELVTLPLWSRYSKKMAQKILNPRNVGFFIEEDAIQREMRCITGREGFIVDGHAVQIYWLVDPTDGVIVDAKFQVFGESALIAAADTACELCIGKNYDQIKRIGVDLLDKQLRDQPDEPAFPNEVMAHLNLVIDALEDATSKCSEIPLAEAYVSPVPRDLASKEGGGYPGWLKLSYEQKLSVIEEVLNEDVRPYVELDEGGIEVQKLVNDKELIIAYQGACTSCFSAIGATLSTIQQIVQAKVHPDIVVVPNMDELQLE